jgi:hypothetical protein
MSKKKVKRFFVDEAGDLTLFDKKGRYIIGNDGVSKCFMVGAAYIIDYDNLKLDFNKLKDEIKADPYYRGVPSIESTLKQFHACKDLPEIKREVFKILSKYETNVFVAIRRKHELAIFAEELFLLRNQKINENDIYDDLIKRLFQNLLHKADENIIYFSRRGKSLRTEALNDAISKAKGDFEKQYNLVSNKPTHIYSKYPYESDGLQVIDYYLWALQRLFEKGEDRFFNSVANNYKFIMDLDDKRNTKYGELYFGKNKLELSKKMLFKS